MTSVTGGTTTRATIAQTSAAAPPKSDGRAQGSRQPSLPLRLASHEMPGLAAVRAAAAAAVAEAEKQAAWQLRVEHQNERREAHQAMRRLRKADPTTPVADVAADAQPGTRGASGSGEKVQPPQSQPGGKNQGQSRKKREKGRTARLAADAQVKAANERRDELDLFREALQQYTRSRGFQDCGRVPIPMSGGSGVTATYDGKRARWTRLQRCRKLHLCPTCGQELRAAKRARLELGNSRWAERGGGFAMGTFTLRHYRRHTLKQLKEIQHEAWRRAFGSKSGKNWRKIRARFGIVGDVRVWEVTHGSSNGWHPHWHVQYFFDKPLTPAKLKELEDVLYERWSNAVTKAGGYLPSRKHGVNLIAPKPGDEAAFAQYMVKEMTGSATKKGQKGHRTPHQVAQDWIEHQRKHDLALWLEYEEGSYRVQYMRWSDGLQELLELPDEDEGLGEEREGEEAHPVVTVSMTVWFNVIICRRGRSLALRHAIEAAGLEGARILLEEWGVRWGDGAWDASLPPPWELTELLEAAPPPPRRVEDQAAADHHQDELPVMVGA